MPANCINRPPLMWPVFMFWDSCGNKTDQCTPSSSFDLLRRPPGVGFYVLRCCGFIMLYRIHIVIHVIRIPFSTLAVPVRMPVKYQQRALSFPIPHRTAQHWFSAVYNTWIWSGHASMISSFCFTCFRSICPVSALICPTTPVNDDSWAYTLWYWHRYFWMR